MPTFNRPSISLASERKEWKTVKVRSIKPNDIVTGHGLVIDVGEEVGAIVLKFLNGRSLEFNQNDTVTAFVKV